MATLGKGRRPLAVVAIVLVAAIALALVSPGLLLSERRGLLRLPPEERRELYEESWRNATAICSRAATEHALDDRCVDAAAFLRAFPECDAACQAFTREHERGATR